MTKAELIKVVASKSEGLSQKQVSDVVDAVFDALKEAITTTGRFSYPCFGTFTVKSRAERKGRNPQTKEVIVIKASKTVGFKVSQALKCALNGEEVVEEKAEVKVAEKKESKKVEKAAEKKADKKASTKKSSKK